MVRKRPQNQPCGLRKPNVRGFQVGNPNLGAWKGVWKKTKNVIFNNPSQILKGQRAWKGANSRTFGARGFGKCQNDPTVVAWKRVWKEPTAQL